MDNTIASYRACFSSDAGQRVLGHILLEAGYFDTDLSTEGEIAVQNFAKKILKNMGIFKEPKDVGSYVQKLLQLPNK